MHSPLSQCKSCIWEKVHTLHARSDKMKSTWLNMAIFVRAKKVLNMANIPFWTMSLLFMEYADIWQLKILVR